MAFAIQEWRSDLFADTVKVLFFKLGPIVEAKAYPVVHILPVRHCYGTSHNDCDWLTGVSLWGIWMWEWRNGWTGGVCVTGF